MLPSLGLAVCAYFVTRLLVLPNPPGSRVTMVLCYLGAAFIGLCGFDILMTSLSSVLPR